MERAAHKIANDIAARFGYDEEKTAVISYGLTAVFQMTIIFVMTLMIGLLGGFHFECMIIFFSVGLLRKATGGAHSRSFTGCLFISIFTISIMAFLARYLFGENKSYLFFIFYTLAYILAFLIIYRHAPVDSPNKPIVSEVKIRRLRRNSFITVAIYYLITLLFTYLSMQNYRFMSLATSLTFAMLWQVFMLTSPGAKLLRIVDRKFGNA